MGDEEKRRRIMTMLEFVLTVRKGSGWWCDGER